MSTDLKEPSSASQLSHLFLYEVVTCWSKECRLQIEPSCWWRRPGLVRVAQGWQEERPLQRWGPSSQRSHPAPSGTGPESLRPPLGSPQRSSRTGLKKMTALGGALPCPLKQTPDSTIVSCEEGHPLELSHGGKTKNGPHHRDSGWGWKIAMHTCLYAKECFPNRV